MMITIGASTDSDQWPWLRPQWKGYPKVLKENPTVKSKSPSSGWSKLAKKKVGSVKEVEVIATFLHLPIYKKTKMFISDKKPRSNPMDTWMFAENCGILESSLHRMRLYHELLSPGSDVEGGSFARQPLRHSLSWKVRMACGSLRTLTLGSPCWLKHIHIRPQGLIATLHCSHSPRGTIVCAWQMSWRTPSSFQWTSSSVRHIQKKEWCNQSTKSIRLCYIPASYPWKVTKILRTNWSLLLELRTILMETLKRSKRSPLTTTSSSRYTTFSARAAVFFAIAAIAHELIISYKEDWFQSG